MLKLKSLRRQRLSLLRGLAMKLADAVDRGETSARSMLEDVMAAIPDAVE
jgi:hypothetical protein